MDGDENGERARKPSQALAKRSEPLEMLVTPIADIFETDDAFTVKLDMPGAARDSISVTAEPEYLSVKGKIVQQHPDNGILLLSEIARKSYRREFRLGIGVNQNNIQAQFDDGVLTVTVPKTDETKAREIQIR
jgi:HSP20 family protein